MDEMPKTAPKIPWNKGRLWRGMVIIMILMQPLKIPADPRPAEMGVSLI